MRRYTNSHSCAGHPYKGRGCSTYSHHSGSSANCYEGRGSTNCYHSRSGFNARHQDRLQ